MKYVLRHGREKTEKETPQAEINLLNAYLSGKHFHSPLERKSGRSYRQFRLDETIQKYAHNLTMKSAQISF